MTPIYLYYGSSNPLEGEYILPKQGKDARKRPENMHTGVYATDSREVAIAMALIRCKGVKMSSIRFSQSPPATIYEGWPEQEEIYLYTLSPNKFLQTSLKRQWLCLSQVKPLKVDKLKVADYLSLIRKADEDEKIEWIKKNSLNKKEI